MPPRWRYRPSDRDYTCVLPRWTVSQPITCMVGASEEAPRPNDSVSPPAVATSAAAHAQHEPGESFAMKRCRFRPSSFDALETRFTTPKRAETSDNEKAQVADA